MQRVTLVKLFVNDEALDFYTNKLGFEVVEDSKLEDHRWLLVRLPDNKEFRINLDAATTMSRRHLSAGRPLTCRCSASKPTIACETTRR